MRRIIVAVTAAAMLLTAPAAIAGPTCQDISGATVRCATPGALPVGAASPDAEGIPPTVSQMLSLIVVIGGLAALIALLPDFDGRRGEDWDRQEGDDDGR
jgi:hypothetical protein